MSEIGKFVFLYPLKDIVDFELERGSMLYHGNNASQSDKEKFKSTFMETLDSCIQSRYREKGYDVSFVACSDSEVSQYVPVRGESELSLLEMDESEYFSRLFNGEYPYADSEHMLEKIMPVDKLVIGGFHLWFSVDNLARRAYERGIDTLVDEDLTELLPARMKEESFRKDEYPSINPVAVNGSIPDEFYDKRKKRPWLVQYDL